MIYKFGRCELDTERLELHRDGELQAVEPQVFSLLVFLIESRDQVVSKDDLIAQVWNGRIVRARCAALSHWRSRKGQAQWRARIYWPQ